MSHAPKGGCYVADHLSGTEKFYDGGQFLPENEPPSKKFAKKTAKKLAKKENDLFKHGDIVLRPTPCIGYYELGLEVYSVKYDRIVEGDLTRVDFSTDRKDLLLKAIALGEELQKDVKLLDS